jgi:RimJ/RimL family protein N-acetyltransferase
MGAASELTEQIVLQKLNYFCDNPINVQNAISACQELNKLFGGNKVASMLWPNLSLRTANAQDMQIYFDWANESSVRKNSLTNNQIDWKTHESWFLTRLKDKDSRLYVAQISTKRVGQIRFEKGPDEYWLIGLSVDQGYRGMGLASIMISKALDKMYAEGCSRFRARIKESNSASWKTFEKLNFHLIAKDADNIRNYELITTSAS